ncbi:MAG TPA: proton-conducting transporter membrane subunit, partial [Pirellulales bacterium]|nr:proton-conducting transporter membrane subunit [Pirellulales bacterium]
SPVVAVSARTSAAGEASRTDDAKSRADREADEAVAPDNLSPARRFIVGLISLLSALTCTFGNLAAYGQTNMKRLLAYSTIAHAGYMMMPVAAAVALLDTDPAMAEDAISALCFYVGVYLFMNLGAFAIVAFLRNAMRTEEIADYAGLIRRAPGIVLCLSVILISLLGLPPLAGFWPKALAFYSLVTAKLYVLLVIGGLNTVISLFYYLRVVKIMTLDPEPADRLPVQFSLVTTEGVYAVLITLPTIALGIGWDGLNRWAQAAARSLLS